MFIIVTQMRKLLLAMGARHSIALILFLILMPLQNSAPLGKVNKELKAYFQLEYVLGHQKNLSLINVVYIVA